MADVPEARIRTIEGGDPEKVGAINDILEDQPSPFRDPPGVVLEKGPPKGDDFQPNSEEDELLFGPTMRPNTPVVSRTGRPAPPKDIDKYLPSLVAAANEPDAPKELLYLIKLINLHLGES